MKHPQQLQFTFHKRTRNQKKKNQLQLKIVACIYHDEQAVKQIRTISVCGTLRTPSENSMYPDPIHKMNSPSRRR